MSDVVRNLRRERKGSKVASEASYGGKGAKTAGRTKDSISTVSNVEELGHPEENTQRTGKLENPYQQGAYKRFPVPAASDILKDVLTNYLQEEKYEVEWARQMTKTICEVIQSRVKDLLIPRYKIVTVVHIGQLAGQSMQINSRCLWDATNDTFASHSFKNGSLYGVATLYAVYFE